MLQIITALAKSLFPVINSFAIMLIFHCICEIICLSNITKIKLRVLSS